MPDYAPLWKPCRLSAGETISFTMGPLRLWVRRGEQDWHIAHRQADAEPPCCLSISAESPGEDLDWTRWIPGKEIDTVQFKPRLPDRPVIVRPEMPMSLMPKQSVEFFVGIPVSILITFGAKQAESMEVPTVTLSNSWFGLPTEGELCYALKTTAKLRFEDLQPSAHRAVFPLEIRNASSEKLNFERLCLRPQFLNIFQGRQRLWTSRGRVSYRGEENWSRIVYGSSPPDFDEAGPMVGKARETMKRGTLPRTFDSLKERMEIF